MVDDEIHSLAESVIRGYSAAGLKIVTAESCTGGLIAGSLTAIAGSSAVLERGFVTYSNEAKTEMLGVAPAEIIEHGAVSEEVCRAMALGALAASHADVSVAVTGIAGPGGATEKKPVGLVVIGVVSRAGALRIERHIFAGDRTAVRRATIIRALEILNETACAER
jgi:nicotinamide-nucleotide amidase